METIFGSSKRGCDLFPREFLKNENQRKALIFYFLYSIWKLMLNSIKIAFTTALFN